MQMSIQRDYLNFQALDVTSNGIHFATILKFRQKNGEIYVAETDSSHQNRIVFSDPDQSVFYLLQLNDITESILLEVFTLQEKDREQTFLQPFQTAHWQGTNAECFFRMLKDLKQEELSLDLAYKKLIEHLVDFL